MGSEKKDGFLLDLLHLRLVLLFLINPIENYKIKNHFCCEFLGSIPGEDILFYNFQLDSSEKVKQDADATNHKKIIL